MCRATHFTCNPHLMCKARTPEEEGEKAAQDRAVQDRLSESRIAMDRIDDTLSTDKRIWPMAGREHQ